MIKFYKTEAIVLGRKNIGEADKIVTLLTKFYGKRRVMAKGIRRIHSRRAPHLEPFSQIYVVIRRGKAFEYITEVTTLYNFSQIRKELWRTAYAYQVLELTNAILAENETNQIAYELLGKFLTQLNDISLSSAVFEQTLHEYKVRLLQNLGFLVKDKQYRGEDIDKYLENLMERKLKSTRLLTNI